MKTSIAASIRRIHALCFDLHEGNGAVCCACYKDILDKSEAPHLLVSFTKPGRARGNNLCPECGRPYLRAETEAAAKAIIDKLG